jgi:hypothetical protein
MWKLTNPALMMNKAVLLKNLAGIVSASSLVCLHAHAQQNRLFGFVEAKPVSEIWLKDGFYSYHFQRHRGLNDRNPGIGFEYRYSTVASITAGRFYNSNRLYSDYAAFLYQPLSLGPGQLGVVAGAFNGYPKKNGGWFLAALPVASFEYKRIGVNVIFIPTYKSVHGSLSFQLKLKVF